METATSSLDSPTQEDVVPEVSSALDTAEDLTPDSAPEDTSEDAEPQRRGRPRKQSTARKTRTVELILTVTSTADGDWQAELTHSGKRVLQGLSVPASAVSRAAKELHPDIFGGIETVISAAREQHLARMEQLEAELTKVKQALADLETQ